MNRIKRTALLLTCSLACSVLLSACSGKSAPTVKPSSDWTTTALTTPSPSVTTATSAVPTTATVTTTAKLPETDRIPQTAPPPATSDLPGSSLPPLSSETVKTEGTTPPLTTPTPSTVTTVTSLTTLVTPSTTVTAPVTTSAVTTTKPATTTAAPVTTPVTTAPSTEAPDDARSVLLYEDVKAMWISQYDMNALYTEEGVQRDRASYTELVRAMLDRLSSMGFNTVFLQVRPNADSMVPSDYYPMSKYVVGEYGLEAEYDPITVFLEEAHRRELSVHAWINPLRCMKDTEIQSVDKRYKIRQWYDDKDLNGKYIVLYNGLYYLNPAYEEVRRLIVDGAAELLRTHAFDGLHMDDYFYPTISLAFDLVAYNDYVNAGGTLGILAFRRNNLDKLVSSLYSATKAVSGKLPYGISPAGDIDKVYNTQFADIYNWCASEGYIDYICPQVYFGFEHDTLDFVSICKAYHDIIKTDSVKLIIGMTFGKALDGFDNWAGDGKYEWRDHKDVLKRSLEYTASLEHCTGISVFCYQYFYDPVSGTAISETAEEVANFVPVLQQIGWNKEKETTE